jgi:hypothetical protein
MGRRSARRRSEERGCRDEAIAYTERDFESYQSAVRGR